MANSNRVAVRAFYLIDIEPFCEARHRATPQVALHVSDTDLAEVEGDGAVTVMFLLSIEVKQLINHRRDTALLRPYFRMSGIHGKSLDPVAAKIISK